MYLFIHIVFFDLKKAYQLHIDSSIEHDTY